MIQLLLAFLAGVATVAAPCILPLLPILLGASLGNRSKTRPLFIVAGFVLVFSLAATLLSLAAESIGLNPNVVRTIGIAFLGIFGVLLLWSKPFEMLALKIVPLTAQVSQKAGLGTTGNISALVLGMSLGLVWTPCAGPVLASILTLVALQQNLAAAFILLAAYALGVGVPMLAIAYGGQYVSQKVQGIARYSKAIEKVLGALIIAIATAMYFSYDILIYAELFKYFPVLNPKL